MKTIEITKVHASLLWMGLVELPEVKGPENFANWLKARKLVVGVLPEVPSIVPMGPNMSRYEFAKLVLEDVETTPVTFDDAAFVLLQLGWQQFNRSRFLGDDAKCDRLAEVDAAMKAAKDS